MMLTIKVRFMQKTVFDVATNVTAKMRRLFIGTHVEYLSYYIWIDHLDGAILFDLLGKLTILAGAEAKKAICISKALETVHSTKTCC